MTGGEDTAPPSPRLVYVTVGSDHHPFDRIVEWVEDWYGSHLDRVSCVIQHGESIAPITAHGLKYTSGAEQSALIARAAAVVCHAGPATIAAVRRSGKVPIVVARDDDRGEHVDDHQLRFAKHVERNGWGHVVHDAAQLDAALRLALAPTTRTVIPSNGAGSAVPRLRRLSANVVGQNRARVRFVIGDATRDRRSQAHALWVGDLSNLWHSPPSGTLWSGVGERAFGGWDRVDRQRALALHLSLTRPRMIGHIVASHLAPAWFRAERRAYFDEFLAPLHDALAVAQPCLLLEQGDIAAGLLVRQLWNVDAEIVVGRR